MTDSHLASASRPTVRGGYLGAAIGPYALTVVVASRGLRGYRVIATRKWSTPIAGSMEWGQALSGIFDEIRDWAGSGTELDLALFRPLCHAKELNLPPLRRDALRRLVERGVDRWFPVSPGSVVVDALTDRKRMPTREPAPLLVHVCDGEQVEALLGAASGAGVRVGSVTSASSAAAAVAVYLAPKLQRGAGLFFLACAHATESVSLQEGKERAVRSVPFVPGMKASRQEQLRALLREVECSPHEGRILILGSLDDDTLQALTGAEASEVEVIGGSTSGEALVALGAVVASGRGPDLRPESYRRISFRADLRRTVGLVGLALAMVAVAAGAHLRNAQEEIDWISRRRATLQPAVEDALRLRSELGVVGDRVGALESLWTERQPWTPFLASVAEALPRDAYLVSLRADGNEITVEGYARSASDVVLALGRASAFQDVRFSAPVHRERTDGGTRERFSLRFSAPGNGSRSASIEEEK